MSSKPPLTAAQLRTIWETSPSPAVKRLLWEIKRLRANLIIADQVCNRLAEIGVTARADTTTQMLLNNLADRLAQEPAIKERQKEAEDRNRLFDRTAVKR